MKIGGVEWSEVGRFWGPGLGGNRNPGTATGDENADRPGPVCAHTPCYARVVDILIVHDSREPAKKCSLTPLRGMVGVRFVSVRGGKRFDAGRRIWLHPDGEEIGRGDCGIGLLLIDCTWRRVSKLSKRIDGELLRRRLPELVTAYPRRSKLVLDPEHGLASVEALYAAVALLDAPRPELLAQYRWARDFLAANPDLPRC